MNLFLIYKKEFFSSRGFKDEEVFTFCLLRLAEHMVFLWKAAGWNLGKNVTVCGSVLFHPRFKETTHTHTAFRKSRCTGVRYPWQRRLLLPLRQLFFTSGRNIPGFIPGNSLWLGVMFDIMFS